MRCPTLQELPPPLQGGHIGWPWTEESPRLPATLPEGVPWPRISIVTPSYNQGAYLEETIRSVLLQGYPDLEYFVMDGGSGDQSAEIIRHYAPWLTGWASERDAGQSDAIQQGMARATGAVAHWINAEDLYLPGALARVGETWAINPHTLIAGDVINFWPDGRETLIEQHGITFANMVQFWEWQHSWRQPGVFFPRDLYKRVGGLDRSLRSGMDHDLMCRFLYAGARVVYLNAPIARFRAPESGKATAHAKTALQELAMVSKRYWQVAGIADDRPLRAMLFGSFLDYALRDFRQGQRRAAVSNAISAAKDAGMTLGVFFSHVLPAALRRLRKRNY